MRYARKIMSVVALAICFCVVTNAGNVENNEPVEGSSVADRIDLQSQLQKLAEQVQNQQQLLLDQQAQINSLKAQLRDRTAVTADEINRMIEEEVTIQTEPVIEEMSETVMPCPSISGNKTRTDGTRLTRSR